MKRRFASMLLVVFLFLLLPVFTAFGATSNDMPEQHSQDEDMVDVNLFLAFIPSVQFAPVYMAIENGYFEEEGIDITLEYSFNEIDGIDRLAINNLQFGIVSGDQVILARGAEKPLVYVMEWYHRFPVGVVVPADSDIESPEDLEGKVVGLPSFGGASYIGLKALLDDAGLDESDLLLQPIGFTAPELMCAEQIDAAVVYIVNEPLTIADDCFDVRVIEVSDYANLISNGLVTNEETIEDHPELVESMVRAIVRGIIDTINDPETALDVSVVEIPDLPEEEYDTQYQILLNSIELWRSDHPGETNAEAWELTHQVLLDLELLEDPVDDLEAAYSNEFVPEMEMDADMGEDEAMDEDMDAEGETDSESATEE
jgi:NitT/TauT family transport system substrate-binding protein